MREIDTSKASPEFNAWVATDVMGWHHKEIGDLGFWCFDRTKETHPETEEEWLRKFPEEATGWWVDEVQTDVLGLGYRGVWAPTADIAAAFEMEHAIGKHSSDRRRAYVDALVDVCYDGLNWADYDGLWMLIDATPLQRCQAAYRALTKDDIGK